MKNMNLIVALIVMMATVALSSCSWNAGKGDVRDRNLETATLARLDSICGVEYIGLSDTHDFDNGDFQAVVIYNVPDSAGNMVERNARVTTNADGSEILAWEDLDCQVLGEVKQKVSDKLEEIGVNIDGSLIDALINLKRNSE